MDSSREVDYELYGQGKFNRQNFKGSAACGLCLACTFQSVASKLHCTNYDHGHV